MASHSSLQNAAVLDHRKHPRVTLTIHIPVGCDGGSAPFLARARNLSLGGIFVIAKTLLASGTTVKLAFDAPHGKVRVRGIVRYASPAQGMGIQFTSMECADRGRLREFVSQFAR